MNLVSLFFCYITNESLIKISDMFLSISSNPTVKQLKAVQVFADFISD